MSNPAPCAALKVKAKQCVVARAAFLGQRASPLQLFVCVETGAQPPGTSTNDMLV